MDSLSGTPLGVFAWELSVICFSRHPVNWLFRQIFLPTEKLTLKTDCVTCPRSQKRVREGMMIQTGHWHSFGVCVSVGPALARLLGRDNELNRILYDGEVNVGV